MRGMGAAGPAMSVIMALIALLAMTPAAAGGEDDLASSAAYPPTYVTGTLHAALDPLGCGGSSCLWEIDTTASDPRLSGRFVLWSTGTSDAGTWGTAEVCTPPCGWGDPDEHFSWDGEWFAVGMAAVGLDTAALDKVSDIWLRGLDENEGLSAILHVDRGELEGWVFPTP